MRALCMALAFLVACSSTEPVELKVRVFTDGKFDDADREALLDDAGELLGLELVEHELGAITIELVHRYSDVAGRTFPYGACNVHIRSDYDSVVLAHELGHALGLKHAPDPDNLMFPRVGRDTTELKEWQSTWLRRMARLKGACL